MKTWEQEMEHAPTKAYYDKLCYIIKDIITEIRPYNILEIGFGDGISAHAFLDFDLKLTSVDIGDTSDRAFEYIKTYPGRFNYLPLGSDKYFELYTNLFDIIYIDGDHSYDQTKKDLTSAWKCLDYNGIIIGHDYLHPKNFGGDYGVARAFNEFIKEKDVEAHIYPPNPGLIVIKK